MSGLTGGGLHRVSYDPKPSRHLGWHPAACAEILAQELRSEGNLGSYRQGGRCADEETTDEEEGPAADPGSKAIHGPLSSESVSAR
jgi:hypothetical protein